MAVASDLICKPLPEGTYKQIIGHLGGVDLERGAWISGGSVRKVWFDLPWMDQDVDYFFQSREAFDLFTSGINRQYESTNDYVSVMDFNSLEPIKRSSTYMSCYSTDNAYTYTFERFGLLDEAGKEIANLEMRFKLQAIRKYFPTSLAELFGSFDFTVCQFATDGKTMVATRSAVEDCESGIMRMIPNTPRKVSALRIAKYGAYGFAPEDGLMEEAMRAMANDEPLGAIDDY